MSHLIDLEWMKEAYRRTRKDGAVGVDGIDAAQYGRQLEENLATLLRRFHEGSYRAPPVRRVYIPKGDGTKLRPIGIPTLEDKILQRAVAMLLGALYEQDFHPGSYGFRPGRSAHDALRELQRWPTYKLRCWVQEADIRSFFDTLDHARLRSILDQRVRDGVIRRTIDKWLAAGVLEAGRLARSADGTPQGGVISPLLANIYLHHVLDGWFERVVRPRLRGRSLLIRYADDFVLLFEREDDARRVAAVLRQRFARFGLELHPDKTRLLPFSSPGLDEAASSFNFLGFTHFWARSRKGRWIVKRRTAKDRFTRTLHRVKAWCQSHRHFSLREQHLKLSQMLRGHYGYFGITGNGDALSRLLHEVKRLWGRCLARRSSGRFTWQWFTPLLARFPLPPAHPTHSVAPSEPAT